MDPLTIGFEEAFYEANADDAKDADATATLVATLRRVVDASPHRARPVTISVPEAGVVEIRRGEQRLVLAREEGGWRLGGSRDPAPSGKLAEALTRWLIT